MNTTNTKHKVCLVGRGRMGKYREQVINEHPSLRIVCTVDPNAQGATFKTYEDAISGRKEPFDCVWISASSHLHPEIIVSVAQIAPRPKIIFCEKPIASTALSVARCYQACAANGVALVCGWMRRFDPGYAALSAALQDHLRANPGDAIAAAQLNSFDWPPVERKFLASLGSIFEDLMCHDFNIAAMLTNNEIPASIEARAYSSLGDSLMDVAQCTLSYRTGAVFRLEARRISPSEVYENTALVTTKAGKQFEAGHGIMARSFFERHDKNYRAEVDFVAMSLEAAAAGRPLLTHPSPPEACAITSTLISLAEKSAADGGKKIFVNRPELAYFCGLVAPTVPKLSPKL